MVLIGWRFCMYSEPVSSLVCVCFRYEGGPAVSDPRAMGWLPPNYWGGKVRTIGRSGERLAALIGLARRSLRPETRVVMMVALHCDLADLTDCSAVQPRGLLRVLQPPVANLYNIITSVDYEWRTHRESSVIFVVSCVRVCCYPVNVGLDC